MNKMLVTRLVAIALFGAAAYAWANPLATVDRAIAAAGGAKALGSLKTISMTGITKHWEPDQSHQAGGEKRFAAESSFAQTRDLDARAARTEWQRKFAYPAPREFKFTEIVAGGAGYVMGVDSNGRTKQSLSTNPPSHTMSRMRVAATTRELLRTSPRLLLEMRANPARLADLPDITIGGDRFNAVRYRTDATDFIVMFDRGTALPARIRTMDYDSLRGDSAYDLVLTDWWQVGELKYPHKQVYQLNGVEVIDTQIQAVQLNPSVAAAQFAIPAEFKLVAQNAPITVPYQWVIRRQFIGTYLDSDAVTHDPGSSPGLRLQEVAPGVSHVQGGTHNALVVEMQDFLIVFDAPVSDAYSRWVLDAVAAKFPGKPVKYLVLTHHHMDHSAGTRAYMAQGATLIVGAGNAAFFRASFGATHTANPVVRRGSVADARITEVTERMIISDGKRDVGVYVMDNPHAAGMVMGYVTDARLGFVTDVWSPGTPLGPKPNPGQIAVVNAVIKHGLAPERFAGGHGSVQPYVELLKHVGG